MTLSFGRRLSFAFVRQASMSSNSEPLGSGTAYGRLVAVVAGLISLFVLECTVQALFFPSVGKADWWQSLFSAQCGLFIGLPVLLLTGMVADFAEPAKSLIVFPGAVLWSALWFVGGRMLMLWFRSAEPASSPL
jgi:hypothetical protein